MGTERVVKTGDIKGPAGVPHASLYEVITGLIEEKGPITFAEFMDAALYHPGGGYYVTECSRWGAEGDYVTNLDISPVFARMLATQLHEMWTVLDRPSPFHLVEAGAGRGLLTEVVLETLAERYPACFDTVRSVLVEKNPHLWKERSERTRWCGDIEEVGGPVTGCIYSLELLDSMPFHRVVRREDGLKEVYTATDGEGGLIDVEGEPSTDELAGYFEELDLQLHLGQQAEVGLAAREWIQRAGSLLDRGFVITVDYGMPARLLYAEGMRGTLMCHYRHTLNDNPYHAVGMQDITCHVDFTAIRNAGLRAGLEPTGYTNQRNFLLGLGVLDELEEVGTPSLKDCDAIARNQGIKDLIMPGGVGDKMKVFIQHKGVDVPALKGFSFKDMKYCL